MSALRAPAPGKDPTVGPAAPPVRAWAQRACLGLPAPLCGGPSRPVANVAGFWEVVIVGVCWG